MKKFTSLYSYVSLSSTPRKPVMIYFLPISVVKLTTEVCCLFSCLHTSFWKRKKGQLNSEPRDAHSALLCLWIFSILWTVSAQGYDDGVWQVTIRLMCRQSFVLKWSRLLQRPTSGIRRQELKKKKKRKENGTLQNSGKGIK